MSQHFYLHPTFSYFWTKYPALFIGVFLVIGMALSFEQHLLTWALLLILFLCTAGSFAKAFRGVGIALLGLCYVWWVCPEPNLTESKICGRAHFSISSLKISPSFFGSSYRYQGTIHTLTSTKGSVDVKIPCNIYFPLRYKADCDYIIQGTLCKKRQGTYQFTPLKNKSWEVIPGTFSFAESRFRAKEALSGFVHKQISDPQAANLLSSLLTGDIEDRLLGLEFGRLGLQHLLAISGFHFALIASFLRILLRLFFPIRAATLCLLGLLSLYFFFIGHSPSIQRAWVACLLYLIAYLINRPPSALNALGMGLILALFYDPRSLLHLGFQLSFLATAAILLFYKPCEKFCCLLFASRSSERIDKMPLLHQQGYLGCLLLRKAVALNIAIFLLTFLPLLFLCHKFPLLSLIYNLFIPLSVALALYLFLISSLIFPIPLLGTLCFKITSAYTSFILMVSSHPPALCHLIVRCKEIPFVLVALATSCLFLLGVVLREEKRDTVLYRTFL